MHKFSFRIADMEVRSCGDPSSAEIIMWKNEYEKKFCYTLAYWNKTDGEPNLLFVGDRPFEVDKDIFWELAEQGQKLLKERG